MQPPFGKFFVFALFVGLVAGATVYASGALASTYAWAGAVWVPFISWAVYFAGGAKVARLHKFAIGMIGGILLGWLTIIAAGKLAALGALALPATVFGVATFIVLLELTDWFEYAPAYFFGYAGFFAYAFGGYPGANELPVAVTNYTMLTVIGLLLGVFTASVRDVMFDAMHIPADRRQTVFDKEGKK